ncbi:DUF6197 family protein [Allostreptomyces psammosilenae]|uniref:Uncharacterized protein n=1 Tax=Allostreptomyces psammosilenae TaxID=1892865 RepID=A0A852ZUI7_9ACTN|nr:hypothetical protein [Allostreptomyces psammosilenae]NYI05575.1 hypothetical protein [Allostreptomyces psammosilenae]
MTTHPTTLTPAGPTALDPAELAAFLADIEAHVRAHTPTIPAPTEATTPRPVAPSLTVDELIERAGIVTGPAPAERRRPAVMRLLASVVEAPARRRAAHEAHVNAQVARYLDATASAIRTRGWIQGNYRRSDGVCILGALACLIEPTEEVHAAILATLRAELGQVHIQGWNDAEGRTAEGVLAALERAARRARAAATV